MTSKFVIPLPDKNAHGDRTTSVHFTCQRCCQPIKLHSTFQNIDEQTLAELMVPDTGRRDRIEMIKTFQKQSDESSAMRKIILPVNIAEAGSDFMVVGDLSNMPFESTNQNFGISAALFDVLSNHSGVDHPMCEECTDILLDQMDQQLTTAERENVEYQEFLNKLDREKKVDEEEDVEKLRAQLSKLREIEEALMRELSQVEAAQDDVRASLRSNMSEFEALKREEDKQWQDYCRIQRQVYLSEEHVINMDNQIVSTQRQLKNLRNKNVFNATFHIWHSGHFGTINGFRLGRLPNVPVEWPEINAAWGQTVLLLHSLAKKIGFVFSRYRLVPYGNHSYIESLENKSKNLPLYCMGGRKYFSDQKFDLAMVAFLDCLQQLKGRIEGGRPSFRLPYDIEKGKIIEHSPDRCSVKGYSIKIQFNTEAHWTKALKFMLTNLKWALAWMNMPHDPPGVVPSEQRDVVPQATHVLEKSTASSESQSGTTPDGIEIPEFLSSQLQKDFLAHLKDIE